MLTVRERACPRRNRRGLRRFCARSLSAVAVSAALFAAPAALADPDESPAPAPPAWVPALPQPAKSRVATAVVTTLRAGAPFEVDVTLPDEVSDSERVGALGFPVTRPDADGTERPGFLTAAQCANGVAGAPVAVTKTFVYREKFEQTRIGEVTDLPAGDLRPALPDQPWTMPVSPIAVVAPPESGWPLPVDTAVNGRPATAATVATAADAWGAPVSWTDSLGRVVTGRVLDPADTPEPATIPVGVERVVIAADAPLELGAELTRGSAVTAMIDGVVQTLGIVTAADPARNRVVVDLIAPWLAAQHARLVTR